MMVEIDVLVTCIGMEQKGVILFHKVPNALRKDRLAVPWCMRRPEASLRTNIKAGEDSESRAHGSVSINTGRHQPPPNLG